jgi:hypothetical protein
VRIRIDTMTISIRRVANTLSSSRQQQPDSNLWVICHYKI